MASRAAHRSLLLVWHSRTGLAEAMADSMAEGAKRVAREMLPAAQQQQFRVTTKRASDANIEDVLMADGFLWCCPENLASTSGEMLEFFHRTYYGAFDDDETSLLIGRPYALAIAAGNDGTNALRQVERISQGWRLKQAAPTLINRSSDPQTKANILKPKHLQQDARERCQELGGLVAATLLLDLES